MRDAMRLLLLLSAFLAALVGQGMAVHAAPLSPTVASASVGAVERTACHAVFGQAACHASDRADPGSFHVAVATEPPFAAYTERLLI
jgi:hypothetical protein